MEVLQLNNLSVVSSSKRILKNITFSLYEGESLALYGSSGGGKSSILKTIVGAYIPDKGEVYFKGKKISPENISNLRAKTAYVGQEASLHDGSVRESLLLPFSFSLYKSQMPSEKKISEVLSTLLLPKDILEKNSSVISGGERSRIAIARALLLEKEVFLFDEITAALDEASKEALIYCLKEKRLTILSVSHDRRWLNSCNRFIKIIDGINEESKDEIESTYFNTKGN